MKKREIVLLLVGPYLWMGETIVEMTHHPREAVGPLIFSTLYGLGLYWTMHMAGWL